MNLLRNISQVFPVDLHWMISPVPVAPRLLLFSQASTDTRPSASRVGARTEPRVSCVRLLPCSPECEPRRGGRSCAQSPAVDIRQRNRWRLMSVHGARVMSSGGRGRGQGDDVRWADDDALFSLRSPVLIILIPLPRQRFFFSFFFWFPKQIRTYNAEAQLIPPTSACLLKVTVFFFSCCNDTKLNWPFFFSSALYFYFVHHQCRLP